jgi:hypothetical protein
MLGSTGCKEVSPEVPEERSRRAGLKLVVSFHQKRRSSVLGRVFDRG